MGRGSKAKVTVQKAGNADPELIGIFNQMLDPNSADPQILITKYNTMYKSMMAISRYLNAFVTGPIPLVADKLDFSSIADYTKKYTDELRKFELTIETIKEHFTSFKESWVVSETIILCSSLSNYKIYIEDINNLDYAFINTIPMNVKVFPFSDVSFNIIWSLQALDQKARSYILTLLHYIYVESLTIYKNATTPDIDIKKFSNTLINSISNLENVPELNRCKDVFNKIKESVGLLEDNFGSYYKDFIQSKNPSTLIESFISDVYDKALSDDTDVTEDTKKPNSTKLTFQFRTLMNYCRKVSSSQKQDPRAAALLEKLQTNMARVEKLTSNPLADQSE